MKRIQSTVTYTVPSWNFCNSDVLLPGAKLRKDTCRFCSKTKAGPRCMLYDKSLARDGEYITKTSECRMASACSSSVIEEVPAVPTVDPRDLIKQTIDLYSKTVNDLVNQGYPRQMAEMAAKKHLLG